MSDLTAVTTLDEAARPRRADALLELDLDGEVLLVDPRTDGIHQLNPVATIIWSVLDGDATARELVDDLADAFAADVDVVEGDVAVLLERLDSAALLAGSDPPEYLLVDSGEGRAEPEDGLWRPEYLTDPPAP